MQPSSSGRPKNGALDGGGGGGRGGATDSDGNQRKELWGWEASGKEDPVGPPVSLVKRGRARSSQRCLPHAGQRD